MEDAWDWVQEELKKMQEEMPADPEAVQVVDAISVADFWKRRYDEELMHWERKLEMKEDEKRTLQGRVETHEGSIKELVWKLKEVERRWEQEKLLLEDRIKTKEVETELEKSRLQWENRLRYLEDENKDLKLHLSKTAGVALSPAAAGVALPEQREWSREKEEALRKSEEEMRAVLARLEREKEDVARALAAKENEFQAERDKWRKAEVDVVTVSSQMSQQLSNLREREKEHFVILEDLARGFAHRVRNYLGIMSGTIQLCLSTYKMEKDLEDQLKVVDQNVQDMLQSIEDFLNLARIPELYYQPLNLNQMLDTVIQSVSAKLKSPNVSVQKKFATALPSLKGDQKLLEEALRHLIENAFEAMPQGGELTLVTAYDGSRDLLTVQIMDTGIGISETHLKKIFQPYFSSKKNRKGLGLTIAKRVTDLHRGTLTVESAKGKGTNVSLHLFPAAVA